MRYQGTLIAVSDMAKAKHFYETVMEQTVLMDLGVHVAFKGGVSLQSNYPELVGKDLQMHARPNNFQLYFCLQKVPGFAGISVQTFPTPCSNICNFFVVTKGAEICATITEAINRED